MKESSKESKERKVVVVVEEKNEKEKAATTSRAGVRSRARRLSPPTQAKAPPLRHLYRGHRGGLSLAYGFCPKPIGEFAKSYRAFRHRSWREDGLFSTVKGFYNDES